MTPAAAKFIRRFLLHVLPNGSHRVRHYGLFAGAVRAHNSERVRHLLAAPKPPPERPPAKADVTGKHLRQRIDALLRRSNGHHRNARTRAPRATAPAKPVQDRHLMTIATLPAVQQRPSASRRPLVRDSPRRS